VVVSLSVADPHPAVAAYFDLADRLVKALGTHCEIVLHDLRWPENSLVHVAGSVTGRSPGAPITNLVLEALHDHGDTVPDLLNYRTQAPNGHPLKSSTLFIRDDGRVVGALCINIDVAPLEELAEDVRRLIGYEEPSWISTETFETKVADVLDDLVATALKEVNVRPAAMTVDDRMRVVARLEAHGAFLIKGAVETVARRLRVSRFTIYAYLQQVRSGSSTPAYTDDYPIEPASLESTDGDRPEAEVR
jgi:predicted transcriptional regulator YheO